MFRALAVIFGGSFAFGEPPRDIFVTDFTCEGPHLTSVSFAVTPQPVISSYTIFLPIEICKLKEKNASPANS